MPTILGDDQDTPAPTDAGSKETASTSAPTDAGTEAATMAATLAATETEAPMDSTEAPTEDVTEAPMDSTEAPTDTEVRVHATPDEQKKKDPKVEDNDKGDGITFKIDSFLEIKFFKGVGYLPDAETEEVFFDMVRALYTNSIWESELGNEFLRYKTEDIVGEFDENNDKLTYTFTSAVDMDKNTEENPRTVAYAMGSANFKEYITSLFAHNIAGIKHVDFKNVGTGYRL